MALATGTLFAIQATATTGNTGGAGFNTGNANFPTDATATSANGNSPVISSATYTFVAGDVGAWVYIKSGTNWTAGFYQIASVSAGAATVTATIGTAVQLNTTTNQYAANTVAGVATTASPTGGTFGVDYSQQDTANSSITDAVSVGSSTTLTSATAPWTPVSVGNFFHLTTSGTGAFGVVGWYEIVTYVSAGQVTTDRTTNNGTALAAGTGQTGGAGRLNALEDAFGEMLPAGARVFIKNGSYTFSGTVSIASTNATTVNPISWVGFNTLRRDVCNGSNRPVFTLGANTITGGGNWIFENLIMSGSGSAILTPGTGSSIINCKITNTSTTVARRGVDATASSIAINSEFVSQNGPAYQPGANIAVAYGCYIHDSSTGYYTSANRAALINCIIEACDAYTIRQGSSAAQNIIVGNTIYGREGKVTSGINYEGAALNGPTISGNNIFYGFTTAVLAANQSGVAFDVNNTYFNNTTDVSVYYKMPSDLAVDPSFVGATQITGTTATSSGSVLTQSGGDFSTVTDNVDYLHVLSGTSVTTGIYLITSHTATTLTVNNALGTSVAGNIVYYVPTGHNFQIGSALAGVGFPSFANVGAETTSYPDIGGVQRQFGTSSGPGGSFTFVG